MHVGTAVAVAALVYVPFLLWRPDEVAAAYERQSGRAITPESVWYLLLLRPFDLAHVRTHISFSAGAPDWANVVAGAAQVLLVLLVFVAAAFVRDARSAIVLAALAPAAFLLTNRIFSPQFMLVLFAAWASPPRSSCARGKSSWPLPSGWVRPRSRTRSSTRSRCPGTT